MHSAITCTLDSVSCRQLPRIGVQLPAGQLLSIEQIVECAIPQREFIEAALSERALWVVCLAWLELDRRKRDGEAAAAAPHAPPGDEEQNDIGAEPDRPDPPLLLLAATIARHAPPCVHSLMPPGGVAA